jgi:hypothetical protein
MLNHPPLVYNLSVDGIKAPGLTRQYDAVAIVAQTSVYEGG